MTNYFCKKAVHVHCARKDLVEPKSNPTRYQEIIQKGMYNLNVQELLEETSSESIFLWLKDSTTLLQQPGCAAAASLPPPLIQSIEVPDAKTALALHQSCHAATYCRAPPMVEQFLVSQMLRDTGLACGQHDPSGDSLTTLGQEEVEVFCNTPTQASITDWHYDFQENFTL